MLNRVCLVGRLTADPEMRYTPQGVAVAQLRIAVDRDTRNEAGERDTDFFDVVAWRKTAEYAANYLTKGRLVYADGRLQSRSWEAQDGSKRSRVEVVAFSVGALDRRPDGEGRREPEPASAPGAAQESAASSDFPAADAPDKAIAAAAHEDDGGEITDPFADE